MKPITDRGRTLDAVINPSNYTPFPDINNKDDFDHAWQTNPDWVMANLAHAAYCPENEMEIQLEKLGMKCHFYQSTADESGIIRGREALLAVWGDNAILAFRGTEASDKMTLKIRDKMSFITEYLNSVLPVNISLPEEIDILFMPTDLIDDLDFLPETYQDPDGKRGTSKVHRGFLKATKELWPDIEKKLEQLKQKGVKHFFVTGHSLGAAMAVVAAIMYDFDKVVTFGEPAVGKDIDKTIGENCPHIRYVNGNDPVTKIVPEAIYPHHGKCENIGKETLISWRFDHSIINYAAILKGHPRTTKS